MQQTFADDALNGRKALVFAASQGLGRTSAQLLAAMGAEVVIMFRSAEALQQAAEEIRAATGRAVADRVRRSDG